MIASTARTTVTELNTITTVSANVGFGVSTIWPGLIRIRSHAIQGTPIHTTSSARTFSASLIWLKRPNYIALISEKQEPIGY